MAADRRCDPVRAEQTRAGIHAQRPEREQQVERPAERGVRPDDCPGQAGEHRRKALVVKELRRAEAEVREPHGERQSSLLDRGRREPDHLLVQRAVVQVGDRERLGPEVDEVPYHRGRHQQQWSDTAPAIVACCSRAHRLRMAHSVDARSPAASSLLTSPTRRLGGGRRATRRAARERQGCQLLPVLELELLPLLPVPLLPAVTFVIGAPEHA